MSSILALLHSFLLDPALLYDTNKVGRCPGTSLRAALANPWLPASCLLACPLPAACSPACPLSREPCPAPANSPAPGIPFFATRACPHHLPCVTPAAPRGVLAQITHDRARRAALALEVEGHLHTGSAPCPPFPTAEELALAPRLRQVDVRRPPVNKGGCPAGLALQASALAEQPASLPACQPALAVFSNLGTAKPVWVAMLVFLIVCVLPGPQS